MSPAGAVVPVFSPTEENQTQFSEASEGLNLRPQGETKPPAQNDNKNTSGQVTVKTINQPEPSLPRGATSKTQVKKTLSNIIVENQRTAAAEVSYYSEL